MPKYPKHILFLLHFGLLICSCQGKLVDTNQYGHSDGKFHREISLNKYGRDKGQPHFFYNLIKSNSQALKLDSIENGFETLQIRIWLGHSMAIKHHVLILKLIDKHWHADLISYEENDEIESQIKVDTYESDIKPKNGWQSFIKELNRLDIINLLNFDKLPGYNDSGADGINYYFEIGKRDSYRFYYYPDPLNNSGEFWQAKNVLTFSKLIEEEFDFEYTK